MSDAFKRYIHRPVAPILTCGVILELVLCWIYKARLFATPPPPPTSKTALDFSDLYGPTPPEWVLPVSVVVALFTGLAITIRILRSARGKIGTWHGGKLIVVAGVSAAIGLFSWLLLNSVASTSTDTLGSSITMGFLLALLVSAVVVPLTGVWVWLSARETR
jgi:hypothetical protein